MKRFMLAAALVVSSSSAVAVDWKKPPYDKYAHISIAAPVAAWIARETGSSAVGMVTAALVGAGKEVSDRHFDNKDLYSWIIGGAVGAAIGGDLAISKTGIFFRFEKDF
jgi:opacity protein-like surface antigen